MSRSTLDGLGETYTTGPWTVAEDIWNPQSLVFGTDYTQSIGYDSSFPNQALAMDWSFPLPSRYLTVHSYPSLMYGTSPWSGPEGDSLETALPVELSHINSLYLNYNVSIGGDVSGYDVAFDIWLTNSPDGGADSLTNEIMVWVHRGGFSPAGQYVAPYSSAYFAGGIYYQPNMGDNSGANPESWKYTAIVANSDNLAGQIDFANILQTLEANGEVSNTAYLRDIELGAEVAAGAGTLTINNMTVNLNGGGIYLSSPAQSDVMGSVGDDEFALYGNQLSAAEAAANGNPVSKPQTFQTIIQFTLDSTIINGQAETAHFYINGADFGAQTLSSTPSGYVDQYGVDWDSVTTYSFSLPGLIAISQLKIAIDNPLATQNGEHASVWLSNISVNGTSLASVTYQPLVGASYVYQIPNGSLWDGGSAVIDAAAYNSTLPTLIDGESGTAANPIQVHGGGGTDIVDVLGSPAAYSQTQLGAHVWQLSENAGLDQNAVLTDIARVHFQDGSETQLIPCFAAGTRIATEHGEIAVEHLREGDRVLAAFGGYVPVVWLGHRLVDCARHPAPRKVWPVLVVAEALGSGQPARDLWLSPDHAVFVEGVLIPVKYLLNDLTILQEPCDTVSYYHVELPRHDVLLAERLPVESYLDAGDRCNFQNAMGPISLLADFAARRWEAEGCAPLVVAGAMLEAVQRRIQSRALKRGNPERAARKVQSARQSPGSIHALLD